MIRVVSWYWSEVGVKFISIFTFVLVWQQRNLVKILISKVTVKILTGNSNLNFFFSLGRFYYNNFCLYVINSRNCIN